MEAIPLKPQGKALLRESSDSPVHRLGSVNRNIIEVDKPNNRLPCLKGRSLEDFKCTTHCVLFSFLIFHLNDFSSSPFQINRISLQPFSAIFKTTTIAF